MDAHRAAIAAGETALGLELGSTRIKAVLTDMNCRVLARGSYTWENRLENGVWTYDLNTAWEGVRAAYAALAADVQARYGTPLTRIDAVGISGMMHGYLAFDRDGRQLAPFRTWRNNITAQAADTLTEYFRFHIPQRWSIAHLYHAVLSGESHVGEIGFLTTLAGYIHWQLSGERVLGIGDASGMFPVDAERGTYDGSMLEIFRCLAAVKALPWDIADILPRVLRAGEPAGTLTPHGAALLDPSGRLRAGSRMAPPEGDAGTGMVGANAVRRGTGNISVGTSAFSMNVLEAPLRKVHKDIDIVMTPDGAPVAMVHTNNCSSDINAWAAIFGAFAAATGAALTPDELYQKLFAAARTGDADAGDLLNYACLSGEHITGVREGRPLFVRTPHSRFTLPNFMRAQLYAAFAPLRIGMEILVREEGVSPTRMTAHGGLFKTPVVAQQILADALNVPIAVMETAHEGGPWGMAVLAVFALCAREGQTLADFLDDVVFGTARTSVCVPDPAGTAGYDRFIERYRTALVVEKGVQVLPDEPPSDERI